MIRGTFSRQLEELKARLIQMSQDAGETIERGMEALKTRDRVLARAIIERDIGINDTRYALEEQCYSLIATQQPMARDLREIIAILLIAIELERIADHAKNLAEIVLHMGDEPLLKPLIDLPRMADACRGMLTRAVEAFARSDVAEARAVCQMDDEIDELYKQIFRELMTFIVEDPRTVSRALNLLFAAHNLERVGDRVTNIAERAIYAVTGRLEELNVEKPVPLE